MHAKRTPEWWRVRFQLAVGIGLTLLVGQLGLDRVMTVCFGGCHGSAVGPLPSWDFAVLVAALTVAVAGLVWMVRITRGPRDEPPLWRYRDRCPRSARTGWRRFSSANPSDNTVAMPTGTE